MRWSTRLLWIVGTIVVVSLAVMLTLSFASYMMNRGNVSTHHADGSLR